MYSELVKIVAEKNGVVVKSKVQPKKQGKKKKDVMQCESVQPSN